MVSSFYTKVKVGVTTFIALIVLFGGVLWVKEFNPTVKKTHFTVIFADGQSITVGDPVSVSGIKVGAVSRITLTDDNKAAIELYLTGKVNLSDDCTFIIADVGLMGDKILIITPGTSNKPLDTSKIYYGSESVSMSLLVNSAGEVLKKLNSIGEKIDKSIDFAKLVNSFEQTIEKFQQVLAIYEELASENREPLKKSISSFEEASQEMRTFIRNNDIRLVKAIDSFQETTQKISVTLDNFNNISTVIDTMSSYMESGEGAFARLVKSDELYEEIRQTNANIDSFIVDFKRNPGKYTKDMKFKIRLF